MCAFEIKKYKIPTFHNINDAADISFLDDDTSSFISDRVHAIHQLPNLGHFQILHEVIVQYSRLDDIARSGRRMEKIKYHIRTDN